MIDDMKMRFKMKNDNINTAQIYSGLNMDTNILI